MRRAEVFRISLQKKETTTPQKHIALYYNSTSISSKNIHNIYYRTMVFILLKNIIIDNKYK